MERYPRELIAFDPPDDAFPREAEDFDTIDAAVPWIGLAAQIVALEWVIELMMVDPSLLAFQVLPTIRRRRREMHRLLSGEVSQGE